MKIIFSKKISKKEKIKDKRDIIKAYTKGIFVFIKGENLPRNSKLIKLYITSIKGAQRAVFLVDNLTGDGFFLFCRSKNDKIGKNIVIKNPLFKRELEKYLQLLEADIRINNLDLFEIDRKDTN